MFTVVIDMLLVEFVLFNSVAMSLLLYCCFDLVVCFVFSLMLG